MITFFFSEVSLIFTFLVIVAIAGLYSERAGVVGLAINGNMIIGALVFSFFGFYYNKYHHFNQWIQILALVVTILVCMIFSLLFAVASLTLQANQFIVATAVNILASGIGLFVTAQPQNVNGRYPTHFILWSFDHHGIVHIFLLLAIMLIIFTFIFFRYTKLGVRYVGLGENPNALYNAGINVIRNRYWAVIISGALAGISGAVFTFQLSNSFVGHVRGQGYIGIAIMIFGLWRVTFITIVAFFFSLLLAWSDWVLLNSSNVFLAHNPDLIKVLPFLFPLLALIFFRNFYHRPPALGLSFQKSRRA